MLFLRVILGYFLERLKEFSIDSYPVNLHVSCSLPILFYIASFPT